MTEEAFSVTIQNYPSWLKTCDWISAQIPRWLLEVISFNKTVYGSRQMYVFVTCFNSIVEKHDQKNDNLIEIYMINEANVGI